MSHHINVMGCGWFLYFSITKHLSSDFELYTTILASRLSRLKEWTMLPQPVYVCALQLV